MDNPIDLSLPSRDRRPGLCPACALTVYELACDACGAQACGCSVCRSTMDLLSQPGAGLRSSVWTAFGCVGDDETFAEALEPYVLDVVVAKAAPVPAEREPWYSSADDNEPEPEPEPEIEIALPDPSILCPGLLQLCGLSGAEAESVLGQKAGTIRKKSAGLIPYVSADLDRLRALWIRIEANDADLTGGPRDAAQALALLRSKSV